MTMYRVLQQQTPDGNTSTTASPSTSSNLWRVAGPDIEAASPEAAVRKHLDGAAKGGGTFVAIPARSFKPLTVAVEQVTKVTVS